LDGDRSRPIPDKVLGSGMPVTHSLTHTDPFLNPRRLTCNSNTSTVLAMNAVDVALYPALEDLASNLLLQ
jgi:hypothetical protein